MLNQPTKPLILLGNISSLTDKRRKILMFSHKIIRFFHNRILQFPYFFPYLFQLLGINLK